MFNEGTLSWDPREHPSALCALGKAHHPSQFPHQNSGLKSELSKFNISSLQFLVPTSTHKQGNFPMKPNIILWGVRFGTKSGILDLCPYSSK